MGSLGLCVASLFVGRVRRAHDTMDASHAGLDHLGGAVPQRPVGRYRGRQCTLLDLLIERPRSSPRLMSTADREHLIEHEDVGLDVLVAQALEQRHGLGEIVGLGRLLERLLELLHLAETWSRPRRALATSSASRAR